MRGGYHALVGSQGLAVSGECQWLPGQAPWGHLGFNSSVLSGAVSSQGPSDAAPPAPLPSSPTPPQLTAQQPG